MLYWLKRSASKRGLIVLLGFAIAFLYVAFLRGQRADHRAAKQATYSPTPRTALAKEPLQKLPAFAAVEATKPTYTRDDEVEQLLNLALRETDPDLQRQAARDLLLRDRAAGENVLLQYLASAEAQTRLTAAEELRDLEAPGTLAAVNKAMASETDPEVLQALTLTREHLLALK